MTTEEDVLTSLDHYEHAVIRVAGEFRAHDAPVEPRHVRLDDLDSIVVDYGTAGQCRTYSLGGLPAVASVEEAIVELTDLLQEKVLEAGDTAWPGCLPGHRHPPSARLVSGAAVWTCPEHGTTLARLG
ncbi:hypothetical protein V6U77_08205 [Micromonospora sp. CPCC 205546]|uniref:hypothetical protein n=1 Tax=Micromonospora sp. CPCC 205546 TaxID=3122397 RepID=UPI002FF077CB